MGRVYCDWNEIDSQIAKEIDSKLVLVCSMPIQAVGVRWLRFLALSFNLDERVLQGRLQYLGFDLLSECESTEELSSQEGKMLEAIRGCRDEAEIRSILRRSVEMIFARLRLRRDRLRRKLSLPPETKHEVGS